MKRSKFSWTQVVEMVNEILRTGLVAPDAPREVAQQRQVVGDETLAKRLALFISVASTTGEALVIDFESWIEMACSIVASKNEAFLYRRVDDPMWKLLDCNPFLQPAAQLTIDRRFLFQHRENSTHYSMSAYVRTHLEKVKRTDIGLESLVGMSHLDYDHELGRLFRK